MLFSIGGQFYGIDIEEVKRILPFQKLTEIPDEEDYVEGMFQYEDNVMKVLSFRKLIGQECISTSKVENQRCLILAKEDENIGVNIDRVEDIVHVQENLLHTSDPEQTIGTFMRVEAILEHENKLVTIIKDISSN